jgi:hypothetical protein
MGKTTNSEDTATETLYHQKLGRTKNHQNHPTFHICSSTKANHNTRNEECSTCRLAPHKDMEKQQKRHVSGWVQHATACNNSPAPLATPLQVRRLAKFKFRGSTKAVFDTIVAVSSSPFPTRPLTHVCTDAGLAPGTTRQTDFPLS